MTDPADSQGIPAFETYEIAEPKSYESFTAQPPPGPMPAPAPPAAPSPPLARRFAVREEAREPQRSRYWEPWEEAEKQRPAPPEERKELVASRTPAPGPHERREDGRVVRAIWIVHGMGQQIPFETVDSLANGILSVAQPRGQITPRIRTVKIGGQTLQRVELDVDGAANSHNRYRLHLYEAYWAPMTEGVAKLTDVIGFLLDGAFRGFLNFLVKFKRAVFGGMEPFRISVRTPVWLILALLILGALTVINGVVLTAGAAKTKIPVLAGSSLEVYWPQLTAVASWVTLVAFTFGVVLFLAEMAKPRPQSLRRPLRLILSILVWLSFVGTVLAILAAALEMLLVTYLHSLPSGISGAVAGWLDAMHFAQAQGFVTLAIAACIVLVALALGRRGRLRSAEKDLRADGLLLVLLLVSYLLHVASLVAPAVLFLRHGLDLKAWISWELVYSTAWVWPLLIVLSAKVRTILVEYVGDVAIYVTPNKLDRFQDVRDKIKTQARTVASAVYKACERGEFLYDQVAIVGHSLGSVIAYDTLNALMLEDWLSGNQLGIAHRTNSLITFGSPLEKTAFLFSIQGKDTLCIRERLAATVQPLIQSYRKFRKFPWINVYSRNDIVSGDLKFYDLPGVQAPPAVENIIDTDACIPLVAHVDYWKNPLLWTRLYSQIAP